MKLFRKIDTENIDQEKVGDFVKRLRTSHNLTQDELAQNLYVSRQAISKWERGESIPGPDIVKNISRIFGVTLEEFYNGDFKPLSENKNLTSVVICNPIFNLIFLFLIIFLVVYLPSDRKNNYIFTFSSDYFNIENGYIFVENNKFNIFLEKVYIPDNENPKYKLTFYIDNNDVYECIYYNNKCEENYYSENVNLNHLNIINHVDLSVIKIDTSKEIKGLLSVNKIKKTKHIKKYNRFKNIELNQEYKYSFLKMDKEASKEEKNYYKLSDNFFNKYYKCLKNKYYLKNNYYTANNNKIIINTNKYNILIDNNAIEFHHDNTVDYISKHNHSYIFNSNQVEYYNQLYSSLLAIKGSCY